MNVSGDPTTYARLLELVFRRLDEAGLLPADARWPDPGDSHRASASLKRAVLVAAYGRAGPEAILDIGNGLPRAGTDPWVRVLLARRTPTALCQTFCRLEAYGHSENRTTIEDFASNAVVCGRRKQGEGVPTFVEDLLILGLLRALLEAIGARSVVCDARAADSTVVFWSSSLSQDVVLARPDPLSARPTRWTLSWDGFEPRARPDARAGDGGADATNDLAGELSARDPSGQLRRLALLIADDPGHRRRIGESARLLGLSTRTLQRLLAAAGTTFASITRRARLDAALAMMTDRALPLTLIAHACGFADSAHLSRDVRRTVGTAPSELRALLHP